MNKSIEEIQRIIDLKINPILSEHNGSVTCKSFNNGLLLVKMEGECAFCPSSISTLNTVIEPVLRAEVKEIKEILLDDSTDEKMIDFALEILKKKK
ncbi:MAG: NifU family protein [Anaerovoracaceae bacterium]